VLLLLKPKEIEVLLLLELKGLLFLFVPKDIVLLLLELKGLLLLVLAFMPKEKVHQIQHI
jgi:hypothetical protein